MTLMIKDGTTFLNQVRLIISNMVINHIILSALPTLLTQLVSA